MEKGTRTTLLTGGLILAIFTTLSLIHISGGPSKLQYYIVHLDKYALIAMLLLLLGEAIRAVRLVIIANNEGLKIGYKTALLARLIGRFFGVLTPAYTGATPARAAVIAFHSSEGMGRVLAITTIESLFDVFLPVGVTLLLTIPFLPSTLLSFLVSLLIALMWIGGLGWARSSRFVTSMEKLLRGKRRKYFCYMIEQRESFFKTFTKLGKNPSLVIIGFLITFTAHLVESVSIILLTRGLSEVIHLQTIIKAFLAMEISHVMVMTPTPGGALFFEYGLVGVLSSGVLVTWRVTFIVFSLLPGILLLTVTGKARRYIEESLKGRVSECEDSEIIRYAHTSTRISIRGAGETRKTGHDTRSS